MLAAFLMIAMYPDLAPMRWPSNDPKSLELLARTPVNCVWLEKPLWSEAFAAEAAKRGIATLGVIRREGDPLESARELTKLGFTGGVLEGEYDEYTAFIVGGILQKAKMLAIESVPRSKVRFEADAPIVATYQGVWPGVRLQDENGVIAGPSATPWIDTNAGFLRFARASTNATVWMANQPPPKTVVPVQRYLQVIGDAAMNGARWVVSLDEDFSRRLLAREAKALAGWAQIAGALQQYESHPEWRGAGPFRGVAVVEDATSGALVTGGLMDMMIAKHLPVFAAPPGKLGSAQSALAVVEPEPAALTPEQKQLVAGKILVEGPKEPGKPADPDAFLLSRADSARADAMWRKVDEAIGRKNLGVRLFNVSGVLANTLAMPRSQQVLVHLVNYTDYPATNLTVHVLGTYRRARMYRPGEPPHDLEVYKSEDGTSLGIDERITTFATIVLE